MTSAVFYHSINPSTALISRTHFPSLVFKDIPAEICGFPVQKSYSSSQENGRHKKLTKVKAAVLEVPRSEASSNGGVSKQTVKGLRILVVGGLVLALAAKKQGFDVVVFERDLSAIRGDEQYRGQIQIQSNALAALEAIDMDVAKKS